MAAIDDADLDRRFSFHPAAADSDVAARHERVREVCRRAAGAIVFTTGGPTREQSLAVTALEEAMFWANAAIARHQRAEVET